MDILGYLTSIPYDTYMLIISNLLIDQIYGMYLLNPYNSSFWRDLYFLKFQMHSSEENAKKEFDEHLRFYQQYVEDRKYGYGLEKMAELGMLNEALEFIRLGGKELTQYDYLHAVAAAGKGKWLTTFKTLLNSLYLAGYDIDGDNYGWILREIARGGDLDIFNIMMEIGKDKLTKSHCFLGIKAAAYKNNLEIVDVLLDICGDQLNEKEYAEILESAALGGSIDIFEELLPVVVDRLTSGNYYLLLKAAAQGGNLQLVKRVIELYQQIPGDIDDYSQRTAYDYAEWKGNKEIADYLYRYFDLRTEQQKRFDAMYTHV